MSRIGKIPVLIPSGVRVRIEGSTVKASGPLGELEEVLPPPVRAELRDGTIILTADGSAGRNVGALHGTSRARVANLVNGVHGGFSKVLDIVGLGFKAQVVGEQLTMNLGKSHPVLFLIPKGVKVGVDPKNTQVTVSGASKQLVGAAAAAIRGLRPPEPYKGTGIRYRGEHIIRKAGKTAAGASAGAGGAKK